ncbi:MAG: hypothetical protein IPM82_03220 [Saprospiraceae bacterium]|nr:hypothetical protein [Saprospiraceae bacterium]
MEPLEKLAVSSDAPTILIVEDNPDVVLYLKSCLGKPLPTGSGLQRKNRHRKSPGTYP